jgi:hypothetical protein
MAGCTLSYAIYNYPLGDLYGFLYYFTIFISVFILFRIFLGERKSRKRRDLLLLLTGYIVTFVPTALLILIFPSLFSAVESLLCKMAFFLSLSLTYYALSSGGDKGEKE